MSESFNNDDYTGYSTTEASKKYLYDNCVKSLKKGDVWKVELKHYHLELKVSATQTGGSFRGFLRYSIKGLGQWTDFVANTNCKDAEDAKLLALMQFLSYLKFDEINEKFFRKGKTKTMEEPIPETVDQNSYSIEFELDAMIVGPPKDYQITPRIRVVKPDGHSPPGFRVVVTGSAVSQEKAVEDARNVLNEFLDHYCLRTRTAIQIGNNAVPHMIIYGGKVVMPIDFSNLKMLIPDKEGFEMMSKDIDEFHDSNYKYIKNAMNYYRKGKYADTLEGRLINFFIALEALYSSNDGEITFRFSMRLAVLLGVDSEEILRASKDAQEYYRKRSTAVHGNEVKIDQDTIEKIDSWVRKSILYFIELSEYYPQRELAIRAIEMAIVDFESRKLLQQQIEPAKTFLEKAEEERKKIEGTM